MKKYLLFSDAKSPHTLKWLKELVKYYEVYLVSLNGVSTDLYELLPKSRVFILNSSSLKSDGGNFGLFFKILNLKRVIKSIAPDFVNAHYISSYGFLASVLKSKNSRFKLILSAWGSDILITPFENRIRYLIAKYSLKKADLVTSDSYYMSDVITSIYKEARVMTFSFGVDFIYEDAIKKDDYLIFSNRALVDNSDILKILKWFTSLDKRYKLIIANDGYLKEELKEFVKKNSLQDRVEFVGFLNKDEQSKLYKKARYYISIPKSDSSSVSLLEAMNYGCFPIVSNIAANREWILDGINGVFFDENILLGYTDGYMDINKKIIEKRAIFKDSIKRYIKSLESL